MTIVLLAFLFLQLLLFDLRELLDKCNVDIMPEKTRRKEVTITKEGCHDRFEFT